MNARIDPESMEEERVSDQRKYHKEIESNNKKYQQGKQHSAADDERENMRNNKNDRDNKKEEPIKEEALVVSCQLMQDGSYHYSIVATYPIWNVGTVLKKE